MALHAAGADMLEASPSLLEVAVANIEQLLQKQSHEGQVLILQASTDMMLTQLH
jgi:hypothetical protein